MSRVPDRAKMRREYLKKRTQAHGTKLIGCALLAVTALPTIILIACLFTIIGMKEDLIVDVAPWYLAAALLLCGSLLYVGYRLYDAGLRKQQALAIVPPISKQLPTLPAEEVLLRGSQASPASPEELLRTAGSPETPKDALLRTSVGVDSQ